MVPSKLFTAEFQGAALLESPESSANTRDQSSHIPPNPPQNPLPPNPPLPNSPPPAPCDFCGGTGRTRNGEGSLGFIECYNCAGNGGIIHLCRDCWGTGVGVSNFEAQKIGKTPVKDRTRLHVIKMTCQSCGGTGKFKRECLVCETTGRLFSFCWKCERGLHDGEEHARKVMPRDAGVFQT
jgi:DnaJ-class molecular chaperone